MKTETRIIRPFNDQTFADIKRHVTEIRRLFDWPGIPYHDLNAPLNDKFNRWHWHNLPVLRALHNDPKFIAYASEIFGTPVQPSYVFLSMYGPDGVCPVHTDRPQCPYTIDLAVNQDAVWPIYIGDAQDTPEAQCVPYELKEGYAVAYSGVYHKHFRKPMPEDSKATYADLAFFHFVDANWQGPVD